MILWLFGVGILSLSVAAFHRSIPLPVKCTCFYSQILSRSSPGIPFRSRFSFLCIDNFSVESFDTPSVALQKASPSLGCKSYACRHMCYAFIVCVWLACRWLRDRKEDFIFLSVAEGIFSLKGKRMWEALVVYQNHSDRVFTLQSSQLRLQLFVWMCYTIDLQNNSG